RSLIEVYVMSKKISVMKLNGVPKTLLIPLRGRYLETKRHDGIIDDPMSVEIIDSIDHDFAQTELPWDGQMLMAARTEILDEAVNKFIGENPECVIVNLGCGLDTRIHRVDNGRILWYDLDLSESIEIREKFVDQTARLKFIAKSVLDFSWVNDVAKDRKTLFIAEGLLIYFSEEDVKDIFKTIQENFPDSEIIFEAYSHLMKKAWHKHPHIKKAFSMFKWGIETGKLIEKWDKGIRFIQEWHYIDRHPKRWRWMRFFRYIPALRNVMKIVHLRLGPVLN
ncbi:MAG: class I SAM-dependent methyltransferase, partial [Planctomycetes bacterium]|nr:class I SAM-dependent methyltransferase [Planctomycetota bacterium]